MEFLLQDNKIQIRSVSRVGFYDFGANRKRVEELRALFKKVDAKIK